MKSILFSLLSLAALITLAITALRLIFRVPSTKGRPIETAIPPSADSRLVREISGDTRDHPGKSGVIEIPKGADALNCRLMLIDEATQSLDIQYYIWQDDTSGRLMFRHIHAAAERGVKVRLLLDDNGIPGLDPIIASLNAHPNIRIRLFNPSAVRNPKLAGYAFDFFRMNRRMHNKALIADGAATVIGGRNIGDIYFEIGDDTFFLDLDVLAVGEVVSVISRQFDLYWNSESAIAAELMLKAKPGNIATQLALPGKKVSTKSEKLALLRYEDCVAGLRGKGAFEWTHVRAIYDDPAKGLGRVKQDQLLIAALPQLTGTPTTQTDLASAYFVPGPRGVRFFCDMAKRGVRVRILTNSAAANDVKIVHSGYLKYRKALLEAGVELFELKHAGPSVHHSPRSDFDGLMTGSSTASLHAKTFAIDKQRIFIGSFNFDPRSVMLNCEMGMMIENPRLAAQLSTVFDEELAHQSYRPQLRDRNLVWIETASDGAEVIHTVEPGTTASQRLFLRAVGYLPIEWLL